MPLIEKKTQLAAKAESVEGSAETLAAADVVLVENVKFNPNTPPNKRNPVSASLSGFASVSGARSATMEFDIEVKGSGTAGTAPALGKFLKCSGFAETVVALTSVTYLPASSGISSMTLAAYMDGVIKKIWGARGTWSLKLETGKPSYLHFVFTGADFSVADGALLTNVTYESTKPVAFQNAAFTIDSYAALIGALEFTGNNAVALRKDGNAVSGHKSAIITGREMAMTFDPEMVTVATYDFYGKMRSGSEGALTAALAGAAGNIITLTAPKVQYTGIKSEAREGYRSLGIDCQLNRNSGDDEISIALT